MVAWWAEKMEWKKGWMMAEKRDSKKADNWVVKMAMTRERKKVDWLDEVLVGMMVVWKVVKMVDLLTE